MYEQYEAFDELEDEFLEKEEEYTALVAGYVDEHLELFAKIVQCGLTDINVKYHCDMQYLD